MTTSKTSADASLERLDGQSLNLRDQRLAALKALLPEAFDLDGNLVRDKLLEALKPATYDAADDIPAFGLGWPGKQRAFAAAGVPTTATLRPCPQESIDFDTTGNLLIEGDNLEVLKTLQRAYHGKVKMIYIDPPYNTGKDFVYPDNYGEGLDTYLKRTRQKDDDGFWKSTNSETSGRKHANWLSMMAPRLTLARNLLREDGVIFISIDDNEVANLRLLCDEVFGAENFINIVTVQTKIGGVSGSSEGKSLKDATEFILTYAKSKASLLFNHVYIQTKLSDRIRAYDIDGKSWKYTSIVTKLEDKVLIKEDTSRNIRYYGYKTLETMSLQSFAESRNMTVEEVYNQHAERIFQTTNAQSSVRATVVEVTKDLDFPMIGCEYIPIKGKNEGEMIEILYKGQQRRMMMFLSDAVRKIDGTYYYLDKITSLWDDVDYNNLTKEGDIEFANGKKPIKLIQRMLSLSCDSESIIVDFFAGSGTTGHAVMAQNAADGGNRRYICVQLPEPLEEPVTLDDGVVCRTIFDLTRERLKRAGRKIRQEAGLNADKLDTGLRVFKLDSSNFITWNSDPAVSETDLLDRLDQLTEHTVPGRSEMDILWEILLKMGRPLDLQLERFELAGGQFIGVADRTRVISTQTSIPMAAFEALLDQDIPPAELVVLDSAFESDTARANIATLYKQRKDDDGKPVCNLKVV